MTPLLTLSAARQDELQRRLEALGAGAPAGALLSITLALAHERGDWLDLQPCSTEYCYWAKPERGEYRLGLGRAVICTSAGPARFTALQAAHAGMAQHWRHDDQEATGMMPLACLGFAFDAEARETAGELPNAQLGVPAVLLRTADKRSTVTFTTPARDAASAVARWMSLLAGEAPTWLPPGTAPTETALARRAWQARVEAALATIAAGGLDKVVLSRTQRLALPTGSQASTRLLRSLVERHPESTIFAMSNRNASFLGATPERLVELTGRIARSDALAGTAWDGRPLTGDKNDGEQRIVVDAVRRAMQGLCDTLHSPSAPRELQVRDLRHLWTPFEGSVRDGVGLFDLVAALHPTPAVGGWPSAEAAEWLRRHGEQRPGWYSGGIGWIDARGDGEVAVALRCGLIAGKHIELAAGAGIVAGSEAAHEFAETEAKLGTMLGALAAAHPPTQRTGTQ